ncbi:uncharacterized protein LOC142973385 [Anticarsia gemmatalis]|uniref:uncharacterized protein LOC142973385 n=1 Tax=Anticarsia gemmatalis TaxID=129554 RepID=UPI003F766C2E
MVDHLTIRRIIILLLFASDTIYTHDFSSGTITVNWENVTSRDIFHQQYDSGKIFEVMRNQSFQIVFTDDLWDERAICEYRLGSPTEEISKFIIDVNKSGGITLQIPQIIEEMNTKWSCFFQSDALISSLIILFEVKVKDARVLAVTIQNIHYAYVVPSLTEHRYDGLATYEFEHNEKLKVQCGTHKFLASPEILSMQYFNHADQLQNEHKEETNLLSFKRTMKDFDHNSYLVCMISFHHLSQSFIYRTIFKLKDYIPPENLFAITINQDKVVLKPDKINIRAAHYIYYYVDHKEVIVSCEKRSPKIAGRPILAYNGIVAGQAHHSVKDQPQWHDPRSIRTGKITLSGHMKEGSVTCTLENYVAEIRFVPRVRSKNMPRNIALPTVGKTIHYNDIKNKNLSTYNHDDLNQDIGYLRDNNTVFTELHDTSMNVSYPIIFSVSGIIVAACITGSLVVCYRRTRKNDTAKQGEVGNILTPEYDYVATEAPSVAEQPVYDYAYVEATSPHLLRPRQDAPPLTRVSFDSDYTESNYYTEIDEYFINKMKARQDIKETNTRKI